jgi:hypothetical protein
LFPDTGSRQGAYNLTTVAENGSLAFSGDNVPALQTGMNAKALALDNFGKLPALCQ